MTTCNIDSAFAEEPTPRAVISASLLLQRNVVTSDELRVMKREVHDIWEPVGFHINWREPDVNDAAACVLKVIVRDSPTPWGSTREPRRLTIAATVAREEHGQPVIYVSASASRALLEGQHLQQYPVSWLPSVYERLMGQIMGRSIAHELGHYLLQSSFHAPSGLMRAVVPVEDFMTPSLKEFRVGPTVMPRLPASAPCRGDDQPVTTAVDMNQVGTAAAVATRDRPPMK
jgi:hypothetical protein